MGRMGNDGGTKPVEAPLGEEAELSAATGAFAAPLTVSPEALPGLAVLGAEDAATSGALPSLEPAVGRELLEMKKYNARTMATAPTKAKLNRPFMAKFWRRERARVKLLR
jgi:hypothetical protein